MIHNTQIKTSLYVDTERYQKVDPDNPPIIVNSKPENQLSTMNPQIVKWLHEEAFVNDCLIKDRETGHIRINIAELNKLNNIPDELNRWVVWRKELVPPIEDQLFYKINFDFYKTFKR